jgi:hypothetical protein
VPKADILRCSKECRYSITSSAWARRVAGTLRAIALRLEFGWYLNRQVGRPLAFENAIDMFAAQCRDVSNK